MALSIASSVPLTIISMPLHINNPHDHNLAYPELPLRKGMEIIVNGTEEALDKAIAVLGEEIYVNLHEEPLQAFLGALPILVGIHWADDVVGTSAMARSCR